MTREFRGDKTRNVNARNNNKLKLQEVVVKNNNVDEDDTDDHFERNN